MSESDDGDVYDKHQRRSYNVAILIALPVPFLFHRP